MDDLLQCPCKTCSSKDWCKQKYKTDDEDIDCIELCDWIDYCYSLSDGRI